MFRCQNTVCAGRLHMIGAWVSVRFDSPIDPLVIPADDHSTLILITFDLRRFDSETIQTEKRLQNEQN